MNEVKYQIFVSSTYKDLINTREMVTKIILNLYQFPIGMEMFSADDDEQWEVIKETIDISDYYILILGHRYGSETKEGISYTEKEFDYAKEIGIPILSFIRDRKAPTTPDERDVDPQKIEKLEAFLKKASDSKMCDFWTGKEQLASQVAVSLSKMFRKTPRVGWIRADKVLSSEVSEELARLRNANRDLSDEPDASKATHVTGSPSIHVHFGFDVKSGIDAKSLEELGYSDVIPLERIESVPKELSEYVKDKDLEEYNSCLPNKKVIEDFNEQNAMYHRLINGSFDFTIIVGNNGNSPANEVLIDLQFPREILVIEEYELKEIEEPELKIPKNPIEEGWKKYRRDQEGKLSLHNAIEAMMRPGSFGSNFVLPHITPNIANRNTWFDIKDNSVSIRIKKLIHTREVNFDEIKIIPMKKGVYKVTGSIVCEEFETKKDLKIEIVVK